MVICISGRLRFGMGFFDVVFIEFGRVEGLVVGGAFGVCSSFASFVRLGILYWVGLGRWR